MKSTLLFICLLFAGYFSRAQDINIGAYGGFSIPNLSAGNTDNQLSKGYSSRLGGNCALFIELKFSKVFSLQPMVEYSAQGGKKDGLQALTTPDEIKSLYPVGQSPQYLYANYNSEAKLDYLQVPILAKFSWALGKSPFGFFVGAGPYIGILLSAKQVTSGQSQLYTNASQTETLPVGTESFNNTEDIKSQLHEINFGIEGNLGFSYTIGAHSIFVQGGGNYGFINIQKQTANGANNTGAATATIGYSYFLYHKTKASGSHSIVF